MADFLNQTDPNTYPTRGILTNQIFALYDVEKPQVVNKLFRRFGYQYYPMFQMFRAMSREEAITAEQWDAEEDNMIHHTVKVADTVADTGAGNAQIFTIHSDDLDENYNFYLREGDIITIPSTRVQAIVNEIDISTPATPVVTLLPLRSTDNIDGIAGGTVLPITSGAFGSGTGQPMGTVVGTTKRRFYTQILKESVGAEGTQLVKERWYEVYDTGENIIGWFTPGTARAEYLLALKMDGAFLTGVERTNTDVKVRAGEGINNPIYTTKGLIPTIEELGHTMNYTVGSWDITDMDAVGLYLKSQAITNDIVWLMPGAKLCNEIENELIDFLQAGGATDFTKITSQLFSGNEGLAVDIGFKGFKKGGITFMMTSMDGWSNPTTYGVTGMNMDQNALIIPLVSYQDPKNPGTKIDNLATKYLAKGGYSRRMEVWDVRGAGGGLYVTDVDRTDTYLRSHIGLQITKANQMIFMTPS